MAADFVQEVGTNSLTVSSSTCGVTAAADTSEGNLVVLVGVTNFTTVNPTTFADSNGNVWTKTVEIVNASGPQLSVAWCIVEVGKAHVAGVDTFSHSNSPPASIGRSLLVVEFSGLDSSPFDAYA